MDRNEFRTSPDVIKFTDWLANRHRTLSIGIDIKSSRFVPGGIRADLTGLDALLPHYRWRTWGCVSGDWPETQRCLQKRRAALRQAIEARDEDAVLEACRCILAWGGDRNSRAGALPYLSGLHGKGTLSDYLDGARRAFALDSAVINKSRPQADKMNSMLTKVHALASADGLPIYDSRVAAAIAALVELWRREEGRECGPLPWELVFPATMSDRSALYLFDDAQDPGVMSYAPAKVAETAARWSGAKIRLGWLLNGILEKDAGMFVTEEERDRMHAFEASLFMIGYDVACLRGNWSGAGLGKKQRAKLQGAGRRWLRLEHAGLPHKTINTLNGGKANLAYAGNVETGISGVWGKTAFAFDSDFLQELLADFAPECDVGLGASMTGPVKPDTLGFWIGEHYPAKSRKYASALGAIFVEEGLANRIADKNEVRIRFL
jgi:hypothetical protein